MKASIVNPKTSELLLAISAAFHGAMLPGFKCREVGELHLVLSGSSASDGDAGSAEPT